MDLLDINVMLGPTSDAAEPQFRNADDLLRELDRLQIAEALVYSSHARYGHPREGNWRLFEQLGGHRDRLHPCWLLLPPGTPELPAPDEIVRQMREHGVHAARLLPGQHLFPVSRRILGPLLAALAEAAIPLILDLERRHWSDMSPWDEIFDLCEAYPRLPVILLREGGDAPRVMYHLWDEFPNLYLETSYIQSANCLEEICERFGSGRILFGSGMPAYDAGGPIATVAGSRLTVAGSRLTGGQRAAIAGNNARRLLRLEAPREATDREWPVAADGMRVWDIHGHLGPWYKIPYPVYNAGDTVRRMDEVGVERFVISDIRAIENDPDSGNARAIEATAEYPGRLFAYAGYAPGKYANNIGSFDRLFDEPGVVGIKFHCQLHNTPPDSPKYRPAFEVANERRLPILTHGVLPPDMLRGLLAEMPHLTYIAAHFAASPPEAHEPYLEIAGEFSNLYYDTTGSTVLRGGFARLVARMPPEQILYGSDFPIMDFPYQLGRVLYADISDELKRKILWENPSRIYRRAGNSTKGGIG